MSRLFFTLFFLLASVSLASDMLKIKEYHPKKDETKKILVKYAPSEKLFTFRWTLYKNDGLVVFCSYDRIVSQHVLYLNHTNQSIRIELNSRGAHETTPPYMLVKFEDFDFEKKQAKISLWLWDKRREVFIRYLN